MGVLWSGNGTGEKCDVIKIIANRLSRRVPKGSRHPMDQKSVGEGGELRGGGASRLPEVKRVGVRAYP